MSKRKNKMLIIISVAIGGRFFSNNLFIVIVCFLHQVSLTKRQRRDLAVFKSSCHLPTYLPHMVEALHNLFNARITNFSRPGFGSTGNQTQVFRFNSRRSIQSTTIIPNCESRKSASKAIFSIGSTVGTRATPLYQQKLIE